MNVERSATEIHAHAAKWVIERHSDSWTEADQARLDEWLGAHTANLIAYLRADHIWQRSDRIAALKSKPKVKAQRPIQNSWPQTMLLRVVAGFGIAALLAVIASVEFSGAEYATYATAVGERKVLTLPDGSRIELNTNSTLRLAKEEGKSEAVLDKGEAYFDIKHNPKRPFVVAAHGRRIVDVGTKFVVRNDKDALKISMLEGRVALSSSETGAGASTELETGDVALATPATTRIIRSNTRSLVDAASWRKGYLTFRPETLADAVAEFNRYNDIKLSVQGADLGSKQIYGTFRTTDVDVFASVAQEVLHLRVKRHANQVVLSR